MPAVPAPSAHQVITFGQLVEQDRNFCRAVAQIGVHGDQNLAGGMIETGRQSRRLPEIPLELDRAHARVCFREPSEQGEGAIGRAIVHKEELIGLAQAVHGHSELLVQRLNVRFLVVHGHDDRVATRAAGRLRGNRHTQARYDG